MTDVTTWRIASILIENVMGLRYLEFKPTGRMNVFTGKNGAGKTSAITALMYGLAGEKYSPQMPMRKGATHFRIELALAEDGSTRAFIAKRTQSGLKLEMASGCKAWNTPQAMLNSIYEELTLDPIEFIRMGKDAEGKRRQVEMLKGAIVLEVDLDQLARDNRTDFDKRREVNREVERLKAEIASIPIQPGLPEKPVDVSAIQEKIRQAGEHNKTIVQQIEARRQLAANLATAEAAEQRNKELIQQQHTTIERLTADIEALTPAGPIAAEIRDGLEALRDRAVTLPYLEGLAQRLIDALGDARVRALSYIPAAGMKQTEMGADLDTARKTLRAAERQEKSLSQAVADAHLALEQSPQPELQDTAAIVDELNAAQTANREIEKRDRQNALIKRRDDKETEARTLTRAMENREEQKNKAVATARMPIEGLTFTVETGKEEILFEGVPISQLGEAQQIRISVAIALARKPQLRIVRIPHGEALDDDSMEALAQMAEEMDFYVWMAKVDTTGKLGIYLEDGEVKAVNEVAPKSKKKEDIA